MDLARAGAAQHAHDLPARGAPDDRVVDEDDPAAGNDLPNGVELDADPEVTRRRIGLDEGPADVPVLDQPHLAGDAAGIRVPHRRGGPRVGHGDHGIRRDRVLAGEETAHPAPDLVHVLALDHGVRAREVDVLEDARGPADDRKHLDRAHAGGVRHHQLSRADLAEVFPADLVERAALRGEHDRAAEPAERQRPDPVRVSKGHEGILRHRHDGVRAADPAHAAGDRVLERRGG